MKPAFVFDGEPIQLIKQFFSKMATKWAFHSAGRKILPHEELVKIGFSVETIGKQLVQVLNLNAMIVKLNYLQENQKNR